MDFTKEPNEADVYPATHHFKIITDAAISCESALLVALAGYDITQPLLKGNSSSGGRYITYNVSIRLPDRATHHNVHNALKGVSGVKILL